MCIRAEALDEERPRVTEVSSFRAASCEDKREYCEVIEEGVARRCGGSGGCSKGVAVREMLFGPFEVLYSGSDGVEALDMFAWPKGNVAQRSGWRPNQR